MSLDVLVALGKNWQQHPLRLSIESRMVTLAAGHLLAKGDIPTVIFSGGHTAGMECPAEAEAMLAYLQRHFPDIDTRRVLLENAAIDTADNAEKSVALLHERGFRRVGILTTACHLPAAVFLFRAWGIPVMASFSTESVLLPVSPHYRRLIARYSSSPRCRLYCASERARRLLLLIDRRGRGLRYLTRATRR